MKDRDEQADALASMADGLGEPADEQDQQPDQPDPDQELPQDAPAAPATVTAGGYAAPTRRARRSAMDARSNRSFTHSFQRTMIPVLLVLALLFALLGLAGLVMAAGVDLGFGELAGRRRQAAIAIALLGLPLGLASAVTAWLFHRSSR